MRARRRAPVLLAVLAAALAACPERARNEALPPPAPQAGLPPPGAAGLRLSLPQGWTAHLQGPALAFGPGGRTVARLERLEVQVMPTPKDLRELFSQQLPDVPLREVQAAGGEDYSRWMGRVAAEAVPGWSVGLCARRAGGALFLGGTVPGATEQEVRAALDVCVSLTTAPGQGLPPRPRRSAPAARAR